MRALLLMLFTLLPVIASGQKTEAELQDRLIGKPLYLRGFYESDKLTFDADGQLKSRSKITSFTVSGMEVTHVELDKKSLLIWGRRMGVKFKENVPERLPLNVGKLEVRKDESMQIEIAAPATGDYGATLDAIFAEGLTPLAPSLPEYWQHWAKTVLLGQPTRRVGQDHSVPRGLEGVRKIGGGVKPPRVLFSPEPIFSEAARRMKISGNVLVYLIVGTDGLPTEVSIVRPVGLGLDEKAMEAVRSYRFDPATENGKPMPVEMHVEVNFQIF